MLEVRTASLKFMSAKMKQFGANRELGTPLVYTPPTTVSGSGAGAGAAGAALPRPGGVGGGATAEDSKSGDATAAAFGQLNETALIPQSTYLDARASDVQAIESHIVDIGQIFGKLAGLVSEQQDMVSRIEDNVDSSLDSATAAESELTKYLRSVSNNKILAFKVFLILVVFIVFFTVFIA